MVDNRFNPDEKKIIVNVVAKRKYVNRIENESVNMYKLFKVAV